MGADSSFFLLFRRLFGNWIRSAGGDVTHARGLTVLREISATDRGWDYDIPPDGRHESALRVAVVFQRVAALLLRIRLASS